MKQIIEAVWDSLKSEVEFYKKKDPNIEFATEKFEDFGKAFRVLYNHIKDEYMEESVDNLDRHKVAAIIIVVTLECELITYKKVLKDNQVFLGQEMIVAQLALSWMLRNLNEVLEEKGQQPVRSYHMPEAFACPTPYFEILCRNLYFSKRDYVLNPLDIAEKLYLIEYITVFKKGRDLSVLKEYIES